MKIGLFNHAAEDRPLLAIVLLLIATFTLGLQDSLMKLMSVETSFWQIQTLRSFFNVLFVGLLAALAGSFALLKPRNFRGVLLRAAFLVTCMFFFFGGAPHLSVTQMAAGLYTYPLFVCLLAGPVLKEKIGLWRIGSVVLGGIGAALVLSPWQEGFSPVQVMPVVAGFFFACNILCIRSICRSESTLALALVAGLVFVVSGLVGITVLTLFPLPIAAQQAMPFIAIGWPQLTLLVAGFAVIASMMNLLGNICLSRAYQTADASLLAPLDFTYLIFAAFWGKMLFDQLPGGLQLAGMLMIVCAGVIIAWREQIAHKETALENH